MTGWSPEVASPAMYRLQAAALTTIPKMPAISTTTIREKTNLVIMAIYELCAPAASSHSLMIGEWRGKICTTALKLSIGLSLAIYRSTGFLLDICDEI